MKTKTFSYQMVTMLAMLVHATAAQAQRETGGDLAGGYMRTNSETIADQANHAEGKGKIWLGYKTKRHDWRLSLTGHYKDVDSEKLTEDFSFTGEELSDYTSTQYMTNEKPFNLSARYDVSWHRPSARVAQPSALSAQPSATESQYNFWTQYDYEHTDYKSSCLGTKICESLGINYFGRFEAKEDVGHRLAVGYGGRMVMGDGSWMMGSSADVTLKRKKVNDVWLKVLLDLEERDETNAYDVRLWRMNPDYTDYGFNAALHLTKRINGSENGNDNEKHNENEKVKLLVVGGGIRFNGEGERFLHSQPETNDNNHIKTDTLFIDQRATGFRYFIEPFLSCQWSEGRWALDAEYGLRLYHTKTTDYTGHAVQLYNFMDPEHPLSGTSFSHFMPLATGHAKLTYRFSPHHSFSLSNAVSNCLPPNGNAMLCFVQLRDYNKVSLGNPHLKPSVKLSNSLGYTFSYGPFSATTDMSVARENNQMAPYYYNCTLGGRSETAQTMRNVAHVTSYKITETIAWDSKWLKASATVWDNREHHQDLGEEFSESVVDNNSWGWQLKAKTHLGRGWTATTNFHYTSGYRSMTYEYGSMWPSAAASIEKHFGPVTVYLNASGLIDPAIRFSIYDEKGHKVYTSENRKNNRIVMLGCRFSLFP